MVHIHGDLSIAAPIERVFDTLAHSRNEPLFNPSMTLVELFVLEPVGLGIRFRARMGPQESRYNSCQGAVTGAGRRASLGGSERHHGE
jgi:hypothetical protein